MAVLVPADCVTAPFWLSPTYSVVTDSAWLLGMSRVMAPAPVASIVRELRTSEGLVVL